MTDYCRAILSADKIGRLCRSSDIPLSTALASCSRVILLIGPMMSPVG